MQTVTFTGSVSSDGNVIGDFWYEYQNRGSRYAPQTGTSYELTLSNPPAGAYQLCWSHTTAGPQKATGTLTTTVLDGAALTVTKALVDIVPGEGVLTYELVVTNHGPGKAIDVILKDTLPFGVQVDSIGPYDDSPQELSADQPRASFRVDDVDVSCELSDLEGQPIVSCHLGDLEVGQEVVITIRVLLMGEDTGTIRNHIAVSAANGPFEDDADAVETSIDFWGEPIATCALEITWRALPQRRRPAPCPNVVLVPGSPRGVFRVAHRLGAALKWRSRCLSPDYRLGAIVWVLLVPTSSLSPAGGDVAATSDPVLLPQLSTITCCPQVLVSFCAISRPPVAA